MPDELTTFDVPRPDLDVTALFRDVEIQPPHPPEVTHEAIRLAYEALAREQEVRRRDWAMALWFARRNGLLSAEEIRRLSAEQFLDAYALTRALRAREADLWRRAQQGRHEFLSRLYLNDPPDPPPAPEPRDLDRPINTRWVEEGPHQGDDSGGGVLASELLRPTERLDRIRSRIGEVLDG